MFLALGTALISLVGLAVIHRGFLIVMEPRLSIAISPFNQIVSLAMEDSIRIERPDIYGPFPRPDDPFSLIPCTNANLPPSLEDPNPQITWATRFDPNPDTWSWGSLKPEDLAGHGYSGRGIYLCGYIDLPMDYRNASDTRIVRLAITKFQVSGPPRVGVSSDLSSSTAGRKTERTIVLQPGGPGESGTAYVWEAGEAVSQRFSDGKYDVLGWDPRGVNLSLPSVTCFPHDVYRDHWSLLKRQYREVTAPITQLQLADAMNNATFYACKKRLGDIGRFVSTTTVARDLEEIRKALNEDHLTGYFLSYGTGISQTYANMFPERVGRLILDGVEYVKDLRLLGECLKAGPDYCALAKPNSSQTVPVSLEELEARMNTMIESLIERPLPGYLEESGPSVVTYSTLVASLYASLYDPGSWPDTAQMLFELEAGNSTLAARLLSKSWEYDPTRPAAYDTPSSDELPYLVICADASDAIEPPEGLEWWQQLWANMTSQSWLAGNSRFFTVLPCRHFNTYWERPSDLYRGDLNHNLANPILLIAGSYDTATPLRNGRRLFEEMGARNARLVIHHGYGHTSRWDVSNCTDSVGKAYILEGEVPEMLETNCYANGKPYLKGSGRK